MHEIPREGVESGEDGLTDIGRLFAALGGAEAVSNKSPRQTWPEITHPLAAALLIALEGAVRSRIAKTQSGGTAAPGKAVLSPATDTWAVVSEMLSGQAPALALAMLQLLAGDMENLFRSRWRGAGRPASAIQLDIAMAKTVAAVQRELSCKWTEACSALAGRLSRKDKRHSDLLAMWSDDRSTTREAIRRSAGRGKKHLADHKDGQ